VKASHKRELLRGYLEIVGDCPDFPMAGEEGTIAAMVGTVPFSETISG
jgi:hypothetical protein